ncbi:MAG: putative Zn-dependent protease [Yoonia sp.]|jgi:predicted Zn-dependent protease
MRIAPFILCAALAGCAIAPAAVPIDGLDFATPTLSGRMAVRNFIKVVETVEPIVEATCRERAPQLNCDFQIVVDDREGAPPNAFQTRDDTGRPIIAFTIPLIAIARNIDELAFIMAHEAAHHIQGHIERQNQSALAGARLLGGLASVISGGSEDTVRAGAQLGARIGARTYSKDFELEADALGAVMAAQAGYDPLRGAEFFFRIPDPGNKFLGTHPANADRLATVQAVASQL